jgi:hypothetical protein
VSKPEERSLNENLLVCSGQNIKYAAKFIQSPLEALGLVVSACTRIGQNGENTPKIMEINLITAPQKD